MGEHESVSREVRDGDVPRWLKIYWGLILIGIITLVVVSLIW